MRLVVLVTDFVCFDFVFEHSLCIKIYATPTPIIFKTKKKKPKKNKKESPDAKVMGQGLQGF
jgi:hypothetical protein